MILKSLAVACIAMIPGKLRNFLVDCFIAPGLGVCKIKFPDKKRIYEPANHTTPSGDGKINPICVRSQAIYFGVYLAKLALVFCQQTVDFGYRFR